MSADAGAVIVTSLVVTGAVAIAKQAKTGHVDAVRTGIGLTGAGIALSIMGQFSPELAKGFAVALVLGALLRAGPALITSTSAGLLAPAPAAGPTNAPPTYAVPHTRVRAQ